MLKSNQKRILVLLSSYNGERYIKEQIESIINQKTVHEIHIRIRDDGSKDCTCEIIKCFIDKYPDRVELIQGHNIGYNGSFFSLLQQAEGYDYYAISDQDDVWLDNKLQIACDMIDTVHDDIPLLYASTSFLVHDDLRPYGTTRKKVRDMSMYNTIIQNICPGHTQVMNNSLLNLLKGEIDTSRIYVYDSWIQNIANLYGRILFDNEAHTYYRQYAGNQLGSGVGKLGQLLCSIKHESNGDGHKYYRQIEYFVEINKCELERQHYLDELNAFLQSKTTFQKVNYLLKTKLFRQSKLETLAFKLAAIKENY